MSTRELRELRNAAFVIGFGFTMGKFTANITAKCMSKAYDAVTKEVIKFTANHGNKRMRELCDEYGIDYNNRSKNKTTDKVIIGFHA
nr:MAG TPA: hypothetical protein [Caudoviricetes sp.]